jgi:hypothetical protein
MYAALNEMLASAHRDELRRGASQHRVARQARRGAAVRNTPVTSPARLLNVRFAGRRSHVRPAVAT